MKEITVYDTSMYSDNVGDSIIMEAVYRVLAELQPLFQLSLSRTHGRRGLGVRDSDYDSRIGIIGGTNILAANMLMQRNWYLGLGDFLRMRNLVLMGVGWRDYKTTVRPPTSYFYRNALSAKFFHAVRDLHTAEVLGRIIPNVLFTSCPTLWDMTPERCAAVPVRKARHVVLALTYYEPMPKEDLALYEVLKASYEKVYFWPQQLEDVEYAHSVGIKDFHLIPPLVGSYKSVLVGQDVDVIGSRLHGGIFALAHNRRALILAVDTRAREMARSTGLPVIERTELDRVREFINDPRPLELTLPIENIAKWKAQFREHFNSTNGNTRG